MGRLHELKETREKINAEIRMLQNTEATDAPSPVDQFQTVGEAGKAERDPASIIDDLFTYHSPDRIQAQSFETVRDAAKHLAMVIWKNCPYGSDRTAAIRQLRETVMTANASIALRGRGL